MILMDFMPKEMRPPGKVFHVLNLNLGHDLSLIKKPSSALQEKSNTEKVLGCFNLLKNFETIACNAVLAIALFDSTLRLFKRFYQLN